MVRIASLPELNRGASTKEHAHGGYDDERNAQDRST
jgi:hypothetical protein